MKRESGAERLTQKEKLKGGRNRQADTGEYRLIFTFPIILSFSFSLLLASFPESCSLIITYSSFLVLSCLVLQGSKGIVEEVHLIWSIRDASLFDLFAVELLTPIILETPGVFVHLYITGSREFKVLEPKEILMNYNDNKEMRKSLDKDKNRSVLNEKVFENKIIDEESSIDIDFQSGRTYSMDGYVYKNDSNGDVSDMADTLTAALIISEGIAPKSFNVSFRRADYG